MPAPFIFTDELTYQENARSLAAGAGLRVRDEPFGIVSVALSAPARPGLRALRLAAGRLRRRADDQRDGDVARRRSRLSDRAPLLPSGCRCSRRCSRSRCRRLPTPAPSCPRTRSTPRSCSRRGRSLRALDAPTLRRQLLLLAACGVVTLVRVQGIAVVLAALTAPAAAPPRRPAAAAAVARRSTGSSPAAQCSSSPPSSRAARSIVEPLRRLPGRRRGELRRRRRAQVRLLAPRRARPLRRRDPVRGVPAARGADPRRWSPRLQAFVAATVALTASGR